MGNMPFERMDVVDKMTLQAVFIKILRSELCETELDDSVKAQLTPAVIESVYSLAKAQDVVHIVSSSLYKSGLLNDAELLSKIKRDEIIATYRQEQIKYTYEELCGIFEELNVRYIPLKGSVLRPYYPRESMRTSCDIDILIKEDDLKRIVEALKDKGYRSGERDYHDVSIYSPTDVHLELHFSIQENIAALDRLLKDVWSYAVPVQGCRWALSGEFLLFHQFTHMYYHFVWGGCGIRSLMDVWVMETKMGLSYSQARPLLEEAGIYQFAYEMSKLVESCFGDAPPNDISAALIEYIIAGGTYGSRENKLSAARSQGGMLTYIKKRFFLPYRTMACIYPILRRFPFLLPFCYIVRLGKLFRKGKVGSSANELRSFRTVSDGNVDKVQYLYKRLGIK